MAEKPESCAHWHKIVHGRKTLLVEGKPESCAQKIRHIKNMALTLTEGVGDFTFREERTAETRNLSSLVRDFGQLGNGKRCLRVPCKHIA